MFPHAFLPISPFKLHLSFQMQLRWNKSRYGTVVVRSVDLWFGGVALWFGVFLWFGVLPGRVGCCPVVWVVTRLCGMLPGCVRTVECCFVVWGCPVVWYVIVNLWC